MNAPALLRLSAPVLALALAGCLSPAPREPSCWTVEAFPSAVERAEKAKWDSVRLGRVEVCAPWDARRIAVMRGDGSVAFDSFNVFAAEPAALLRRAAMETLSLTGLAGTAVLTQSSAAFARRTLEITVTRLALDCRGEGRLASVALVATLLEGREAVAQVRAEATRDAASGDWSTAFSAAFAKALSDALGRL